MDPSVSTVALDHVARFTIDLGLDGESQCAGLLLQGGYLLTARHCIERRLTVIDGYDEALSREEFSKRVKAYEAKYSLRFSITIFTSSKDRSIQARLAAIGAGFPLVNTKSGMRKRRLNPGELLSGSEGDWALLDIGGDWNSACVPLSKLDYRQALGNEFAVGAPLENDTYNFISGFELRVSEGTAEDSATGISILTQDIVLDGGNPGDSFATIYAKSGFSTVAVLPGYSGGAFLDATGGYLGVTSFMLSHFQGSGYAPISEIQKQWIDDKLSLPRGSVDDFFCQN